MMKVMKVVRVAILAALVVVPTALAGGGSSTDGYGGVGGVIQKKVGAPTTHHVGGTLPFTGLNLAIVAVLALLLVAVGFGMRRFARDV